MKPSIVLITLFEPETASGEFSRFRESFLLHPFETRLPLRLHRNKEGTVLALVAGVGPVQTAAAVTALGMDPGFDLSQSLWIVAGIAGGDPAAVSLGSPVWADWCVDGDLAWEIDAREIPAGWSTGILPLGAREPYGQPADNDGAFGPRYEVAPLPQPTVDWAMDISSDLRLAAPKEAAAEGHLYGEAAAAAPPAVLKGTTLSAARFWHGPKMTEWARKWTDLFTGGQGRFHTSNMEDSGTVHALRLLARAGRVDPSLILVLRTVSNFVSPPPGEPPTATLFGDMDEEVSFPGMEPALENGHRAAAAVIRSFLRGNRPPSAS